MIVVEDILQSLFSQIPDIYINSNNSNKPFFSWGKKEELNRYVKLTSENELYPLIWMIPTEDVYNVLSDMTSKKLVLILATRETREELLNPQRYQGSYKSVLNPLLNYIIQALQNSNATRITNTENITILKEPNYSDSGENATIDKWDAIRLEVDVELNNQCLNTLKWK